MLVETIMRWYSLRFTKTVLLSVMAGNNEAKKRWKDKMIAAGRCFRCGGLIPPKPKWGYHYKRMCTFCYRKTLEYGRKRNGNTKRCKQFDATQFDWKKTNSLLARENKISRAAVNYWRKKLAHQISARSWLSGQ